MQFEREAIKMRISNSEQQFIKNYWQSNFPNSSVYLFGSRADDKQRGGDIDILVLNDEQIKLPQKISFLSAFMTQFGEQKIDLVTFTFKDDLPFKNIALSTSIQL